MLKELARRLPSFNLESLQLPGTPVRSPSLGQKVFETAKKILPSPKADEKRIKQAE
jgi:hypothetical protein